MIPAALSRATSRVLGNAAQAPRISFRPVHPDASRSFRSTAPALASAWHLPPALTIGERRKSGDPAAVKVLLLPDSEVHRRSHPYIQAGMSYLNPRGAPSPDRVPHAVLSGRVKKADEALAAMEPMERETIKDLMAKAKSEHVCALDIGCASGMHAAALGAHGINVVAIDLDPALVARLNEELEKHGLSAHVTAVCAMAHEIPSDASPNYARAVKLLQYMTDQQCRAFFVAAHKALDKSGGKLFVTNFHQLQAWSQGTQDSSEMQLRTGDELLDLIEQLFRVEEASIVVHGGSDSFGAGNGYMKTFKADSTDSAGLSKLEDKARQCVSEAERQPLTLGVMVELQFMLRTIPG